MENNLFEQRTELTDLREAVKNIRTQIGKFIVGQESMVSLLIAAILADGHVLIEGVPGVAKTLTAKLLSKSIAVDYRRIQFTPDLMPSDVIGTSVFNQKNAEFTFRRGPIFSNIVLIDEINRAPAKTQSALFEVMEEKQITFDGETYIMGSPFIVIATQNPLEQEGTYRLPEAQLDRFLFKIEVPYPKLEEEYHIIESFHERGSVNDISSIDSIIPGEKIMQYRTIINGLHIEKNLIRYIAEIVNKTRNSSALYLGASPRASLAILRASKAIAAMQGRDFVTPEDIQEVVPSVLNHRVILTAEREMEGQTPKDVISQIIKSVEVPR